MAAIAPMHIGFLTVIEQDNAYLGGYLVTNNWGRPMEFRLSTAVRPNRVQEILYAKTLRPYVCAELIGKTLVEKTSISVELLITDDRSVLEIRHQLEIPTLWLADSDSDDCIELRPAEESRRALRTHALYEDDLPALEEKLSRLDGILDLEEPFLRIREAVEEAQKMGVSGRSEAHARRA